MTSLVTAVTTWRYGNIEYLVNDLYIGRSLATYGEWAQLEIEFLIELIAAENAVVVLDVGANIGTHSLSIGATLEDRVSIYALEPQQVVYEILKRNVDRLGTQNITPIHAGVSADVGVEVLPEIDYTRPTNFGGIALTNGTAEQGSIVNIITLDSLALENCHLIKIDVEGMESQVIKGSYGILERYAPIIFVECSSIASGWSTIQAVSQVNGVKYATYLFQCRAFNTHNFKRSDESIFGEAVETSLLFVPSGHTVNARSMERMVPINSLGDLERALIGTRYVPFDFWNEKIRELEWLRMKVDSQERDYFAITRYTKNKEHELETAHEEIVMLRNKVSSLEVETERLGKEHQDEKLLVEQMSNHIKELKLSLSNSYDKQAALLNDNSMLLQEYQELVNSRSWKLTAPLRQLRGLARRHR